MTTPEQQPQNLIDMSRSFARDLLKSLANANPPSEASLRRIGWQALKDKSEDS